MRFAVLCDLHVTRADDLHSRYFSEALRQAASALPDFIAVLGDLTARGGEPALRAVSEAAKNLPVKTLFLPGNSDIRDTPIETYRRIFGETRFWFQAEGLLVLAIDTSQTVIGDEQREWIKGCLSRTGAPCVILSHMPPHKLEADSRAFLEGIVNDPRTRFLVGGHSHRPGISQFPTCSVYTMGGVDPFKPVPVQPSFALFDVSATGPARAERREITLLSEAERNSVLDRIGAAPRDYGPPARLVQFLEDRGLKHVQIKIAGEPSPDFASSVDAWRRRTPGATISIHLANPKLDATGQVSNRAQLQREIDLALALKATSVTAHLPKTDSKLVMDGQGRLDANGFVENMVRDLSGLWKPLSDAGIGVHMEHLRWRLEGVKDERSLGTVPSHLVAFREALKGLPSIGFTLDVGHAWGNGALASRYPPFRWFEALHPDIFSVHLHDTVPRDGKRINHQALGIEGGMVGLEGTFYLLTHLAPQAIVYLEMNNLEDVGLSLDRLRRWVKEPVR